GRSPFSLSIGLFYGRPYRRYYYDPYYYAYDPIYNPFFYDPYYYAPAYYPRYVYPRHYYGYHYDRYYYDRYRYDRYRTYNRPYTPYRFRGAQGFTADYRNRHDLRRSVNTVYNPPISTVREPSYVTPVRQITEGPSSELPRGLAPRRSVSNERRVAGAPIEGRRARPVEAPRAIEVPRGAEPRDDRRAGTSRSEGSSSRRDAEPRNVREQPRVERAREEPRQVERAREEPRRVERAPAPRSSSPPSQDRGSGRAESRGGGGGRESGGSQPSDGGGGRRR
ncbi:MAG TPA: hypothetical protein VFY42_02255, partial [Gemmatimonadales bacterium]|nr:hypothetical protein [Gemmatimonadales bacterium]